MASGSGRLRDQCRGLGTGNHNFHSYDTSMGAGCDPSRAWGRGQAQGRGDDGGAGRGANGGQLDDACEGCGAAGGRCLGVGIKIGQVDGFDVRVMPPGEVRIGCRQHDLAHWEEYWEEIACDNRIVIRDVEAEALLARAREVIG